MDEDSVVQLHTPRLSTPFWEFQLYDMLVIISIYSPHNFLLPFGSF